MARTFSYQKNHRNQQPPRRTTWGKPAPSNRCGKYADLADRVRQHRIAIMDRQTEQTDKTIDRHKHPISD